MFCSQCGKTIPEGAAFCPECGAKAGDTSVSATTPTQTTVPTGSLIRVRCTACGNVADVQDDTACPKCKAALPQPAGYVKLYRMGNFVGSAAGIGLYIDGTPTGYIGNRQTLWVRIPYGNHTLHCAMQMARKCNDPVVSINEEHPVMGFRLAIKMGMFVNSFMLTPCDPRELPD